MPYFSAQVQLNIMPLPFFSFVLKKNNINYILYNKPTVDVLLHLILSQVTH